MSFLAPTHAPHPDVRPTIEQKQAERLLEWLAAAEQAAPTSFGKGIFWGYQGALSTLMTFGTLTEFQLENLAARIEDAITTWIRN